jgi:phosphoribosyl 1,2-cyclic phosphodiesterase
VKVKFWGVRGSIPSPGQKTAIYGGNTPCIQVISGKEVIVLDAGTGIRELGYRLARTKNKKIHILLSHLHWDHIQGLPFFKPILDDKTEIYIYGPYATRKPISKFVMLQFQSPYSPLSKDLSFESLRFNGIVPGRSFCIGETTIETIFVNHPDKTLCYKLTRNRKTVVYTGDNELEGCAPNQFVDFIKGANLLVADAQYTEQEYKQYKGWGHSSVKSVLRLAADAYIKNLVLFHHDVNHSDGHLEKMEKDAVRLAKTLSKNLRVCSAREKMTIEL